MRETAKVSASRPRSQIRTNDNGEMSRGNRIGGSSSHQNIDIERYGRGFRKRPPSLERLKRVIVKTDHSLPLVKRGTGQRLKDGRPLRAFALVRTNIGVTMNGDTSQPSVRIQQLQQRHLALTAVSRDKSVPIRGQRRHPAGRWR